MKRFKFLSFFVVILLFSCSVKNNEIKVTDLKCEYLTDPLGIDIKTPRLSWKLVALADNVYNKKQGAYQVLAASDPEKLSESDADLWNSGKVTSGENAQIVYQGEPLVSGQECYWKVKVWDQENVASDWSGTGKWKMGLLKNTDWKAKWIGDIPDLAQKAYRDYLDHYDPAVDGVLVNKRPVPPPSPMLRKTFSVKPGIKEAYLYVTALGYYEIGVNGEKAGDHVLAPEWTDYNKRLQYQVYDVSRNIHEGENVIFATLGDGWYLGMLGPTKWHADYPRRGVYGNDRRLLAQLVVSYKDGSEDLICTDEFWKINSEGYIISADNFLGQTIDARNIPTGWKHPGFDDSSWSGAYVDTGMRKNLEAQKNEPVRVCQVLYPVEIIPRDDRYIVDFGQNLTGWTKLKIKGERGKVIKIRHGEMLDDDGALYTANLAAAIQTDEFILSGDSDEFEPSFTYHGFRYIEISGLEDAPDKAMIRALAISSDPEVTGSFECSNPKLNQLWSNIRWTQRNNMTSVPTDCPQRDERMGWMGDAEVFCQTSMFNMDMAAFYTKWMKDIREAQSQRGTFPDFAPHPDRPGERFSNSPGWSDAGVIIPWRMYQNYGDKELLRQHYNAMKRYIENIRKQNPGYIWLDDVGSQYGDWLNASTIVAEGYSRDRGEVPNDVFATAFYANSVKILSQIADVLGYKQDAVEYRELFKNIKLKFNTVFVDKEVRIKGNTQSAYALALYFDLLPEDKEGKAFEYLIECIKEYDYRISTGFVTTIMMMKELSKRNKTDLAYQLLESERFPSWLYSINQGATTVWERWDGYVKGRGFQDPGMNSFDHYSIGAVGEWMVRNILGINPGEEYPGYKHFTIHPRPGGTLTWAKGAYNSIRGEIVSSWEIEDDKFKLQVKIPVNTTATVILPAKRKQDIIIGKDQGKMKWGNPNSLNEIPVELGSGEYNFLVTTGEENDSRKDY